MNKPRRILFCIPYRVANPQFGGPKVTVELAAAVAALGWDVTVVSAVQILPAGAAYDVLTFHRYLRDYLVEHAGAYDVVEYDHGHLPYPRDLFPASALMVARSVLLQHHFARIRIPPRPGLRGRIGQLLGRRRHEIARWLEVATRTCAEADAICVPNHDDVSVLTASGVPAGKIICLPFGLTISHFQALSASPVEAPAAPMVCFVGTFDPRKGMADFPTIVRRIARAVPGCRFRFIGTRGMLANAAEVLETFPKSDRRLIEVVPEYAPADLPSLLAGCSVGVFPSAIEGFGFAVLEQLAAAIPVVAYNVPGPPEMLTDEFLVPYRAAGAMADRVSALLSDANRLAEARRWARRRAADFRWDDIARQTVAAYESKLAERASTRPAR